MTNPISSLTSSSVMSAVPLDTSAASTYTDSNGLSALKREPNSPEAMEAVAKQVEALFLQMMLKSMRDAKIGDDTGGNEMGMYQDMFDKQIALTISQHSDLGVGALLKRQMKGTTPHAAPKFGTAAPGAASHAGVGTAVFAATGGIAQTPAEFVNKVLPSIEKAAQALGVDPRGLLAQTALETGWGTRMPHTADGKPSFNLFGIKAGGDWSGARATADTVEFSNGVASQKRTAFRAYASIEESVADFANLLGHSARYQEAVAAGGQAQDYFQGIGRSGYATDPDYANKLNQILNSGAMQAALLPSTAKL